jgi:hypothetical protein
LATVPIKRENSAPSKIKIASLRLYPYITIKKDFDPLLVYGQDLMEELLGDNNLKTFKEPIVTTLLPNYFVIYYGQKVPQGAIMTDTDKVKSKKMHLGMGYDLWARFVDKTLT